MKVRLSFFRTNFLRTFWNKKWYPIYFKIGLRPEIPENYNVPESYVTLMKECWSAEPEDRPGFKEIAQRMHQIGLENDLSERGMSSTMTLIDRIEQGLNRVHGL